MDRIFIRLRSDIYRFLSALFYTPESQLIVEENLFENLTNALRRVFPEAVVLSAKMQNALLEEKEEIEVDYAKLFVGPFELLAPPYGSVYLENARRVMGDSTIEVMKIYRENGLFLDEDFKEMPDHITVELEFMSYLIDQETQARDLSFGDVVVSYIEKQDLFLNSVLMEWVPSFCNRINENTENSFYRALSDCLLMFLKKEQQNIRENLRDILSDSQGRKQKEDGDG